MARVGLDPGLAKRFPAQLSGGQQQRVGVARALAADPPIMLMDEPFSAVDLIVRAGLQDEFLRLQDEVEKTIVFVTHDIDEAVKLGHRIAVFQVGGRLAQYTTPDELLSAAKPTTSSATSSAATAGSGGCASARNSTPSRPPRRPGRASTPWARMPRARRWRTGDPGEPRAGRAGDRGRRRAADPLGLDQAEPLRRHPVGPQGTPDPLVHPDSARPGDRAAARHRVRALAAGSTGPSWP